jgi:hypothetical protein
MMGLKIIIIFKRKILKQKEIENIVKAKALSPIKDEQ